MNNNSFVKTNMDLLVDSMVNRNRVKVVGSWIGSGGVSDVVVDVVNSISVEDGSGNNYIIEFAASGDKKMFVKLNKCVVVHSMYRTHERGAASLWLLIILMLFALLLIVLYLGTDLNSMTLLHQATGNGIPADGILKFLEVLGF